MGGGGTGVGIRVCFAGMFGGMFRGMFQGNVSGMFRSIMSYFTCKTGGYVLGYVSGYVSRVCNPCALLKPEPPQKYKSIYLTDDMRRECAVNAPSSRLLRSC